MLTESRTTGRTCTHYWRLAQDAPTDGTPPMSVGVYELVCIIVYYSKLDVLLMKIAL